MLYIIKLGVSNISMSIYREIQSIYQRNLSIKLINREDIKLLEAFNREATQKSYFNYGWFKTELRWTSNWIKLIKLKKRISLLKFRFNLIANLLNLRLLLGKDMILFLTQNAKRGWYEFIPLMFALGLEGAISLHMVHKTCRFGVTSTWDIPDVIYCTIRGLRYGVSIW